MAVPTEGTTPVITAATENQIMLNMLHIITDLEALTTTAPNAKNEKLGRGIGIYVVM